MSIFLLIIHVVVSIFIIFVVLLQVGRGAELGAAFGSMGQANNLRGSQSVMGKITTIMAVAFMITSFWLTYNTSTNAKSSVIENISVEEPSVPAVLDKGEEKATMTDLTGDAVPSKTNNDIKQLEPDAKEVSTETKPKAQSSVASTKTNDAAKNENPAPKTETK
ncbi:MAG: preprotein translocase subunit SecG [Deltaproteobacteria bacterium]|nr:preprotein translocase subunit SecG [Deltaproteobacteria bacterium]